MVKARLPVIAPAKVPLAACVEVVNVTTVPPEFVIVPPIPGSGLMLLSVPNTWAWLLRLTTASRLFTASAETVAAVAVGTTTIVLAAPEARLRVPPLTVVAPE